jgi:hypothetical protein
MPALLVLGTFGRMLVAIFQPASYGVFSFKIFKKVCAADQFDLCGRPLTLQT